MKIYIQPKGVILSGKAWEIRESLKFYAKKHKYVSDWIKKTGQ
ncbi:Z-ring formation inhibitor MciZ [Heyndrickxia vini]|uniref:Z-ring formation inhibitor MciZ n=1 Tax=Heyndrickxia vini TaxID=1476025 RepID=A0ABX7E5D2_9BACI|nr:Z-ring formation inhibitor MciZ [Heyndrickxia vini]QQZ10959.1 Z-ring formation inhibitor MciZ [Heyndrickxia vini]